MIDVDERYAAADETGLRRVDPEAFPIEHGQLDLAPMVREEVLLGVPDAPLCRPDCPGLCPMCGADLQTGAVRLRAPQVARRALGRPGRQLRLDDSMPSAGGHLERSCR